ncbi:MAG: isocitrate dehydrogenase (NADP(+)) [Candidatus Thermoplasmatota archaeon]|nr:isocitrate dehydrogenase (NADP(+)) [Candidatus Thermoplasmatota archaeon]
MNPVTFDILRTPEEGGAIRVVKGALLVPDGPIIPYIEGDGIGPEVVLAAQKVVDSAVDAAYGGKRRIVWFKMKAGKEAREDYGKLLPEDVFKAIEHYVVALKGPLTTPIGEGYRSLNVTLRQRLDLYANVRPIFWIPGVPSPLKEPWKVDLTIFREATEDVYAGIEWSHDSQETRKIMNFLSDEFGIRVREGSGLGLKPISEFASKRLVRKALSYAFERGRKSVTLMHKGNIMKFTEGAFMQWGYEVAATEFSDEVVTEREVQEELDGKVPEGKVVLKDRLADNLFQQLLTRTDEYDVIATTNLNGDYISDAAAGLVGGLGVAPGANIGDYNALFEPIHGSAPKYEGLNKVNPTAEILAGAMLLEYIGWDEAANLIRGGVKKAVKAKEVTYDLARRIDGAHTVGTREFSHKVIENLEA